MIFKTKNYYKDEMTNLSIENIKLRIENNLLKNEIEQLKSEKTILHERKQIKAETDCYHIATEVLHEKLKHEVLNEIDRNFEEYVKLSPIIEIPRECKCKQYATILIERNKCK